ncbi:MAG: tail fiber domain-containing protein, partial [Gammaproteobacteria bacterium]|nr:tail fiber domain-containing protein [Gammaproteobacteria bacterium]
PATRTLFELQNPGRTHFKITNTDASTQWVFTNTGPAFFISLQGTGGPEFKILNNGNAILAGVLTENSDVNSKQHIEPVDGRNILAKLSKLEISEWSYKDAPADRYVGPMAQDFYAAFGLGRTDKGIATLDSSGVALAAIKVLIEENASLKEQNASISEQNTTQSAQVQALEERLALLASDQAGMQAVLTKVIEMQQAQNVLTRTVMN